MNLAQILDQVSKIQIKSITDSLFKYGLYLLVVGAVSSIFDAETWVTILLCAVGGLFELTGLGFYIYFAKKNPDYLRSESFQIRKQSIEILGDKNNRLNPNIKEIVHIANPFSKELGEGDKHDFGE